MSESLGKHYSDGEILIKQGEVGDCMFVIQSGRVRIVRETRDGESFLREAGEGELLGEMSIFDKEVRSATVRAAGPVQALTVDKNNFLRRVHEDPTLAFRLVRVMSRRVRELSEKLAEASREAGP